MLGDDLNMRADSILPEKAMAPTQLLALLQTAAARVRKARPPISARTCSLLELALCMHLPQYRVLEVYTAFMYKLRTVALAAGA